MDQTTKLNISKTKVFFRADANSQIGWGHIVRSMALADMLIEDKNSVFECVFLVQNPSLVLQNQIKEKFELIILQESTNFLEEAHFITKSYLQDNSIIVLDHYQIQTDYQRIIKQNSNSKIVCIDDMHDWHFVADVVINHAGGLKKTDYSCEPYTKLCLGAEYALLRKPFLETAKQKREINKIENAFICFGGSDIYNLTKTAIDSCLNVDKLKQINVVLGSASLFYQEILELCKQNDKIILHQNLSAQQMCKLMKQSDIAIAPASSISYEILSTGLIWLGGYYVDNQLSIYRGFENNLTIDLQDLKIDLENKIINGFDKLFLLSSFATAKAIDGYSSKRLLELFKNL
ncbi:UDP-2,4-diacetamido-2,4,6-trideoxy-beta-L-altropyranose hydrolase [Bernardetia sp. Wsw4-3y2]|uniref:UDP-2,4-diacetamido-2,4, 6-trideoxy-beta-L-altropyranose hydrolase n=1 Tax=Bernardetia sp. Wsw4-3y2 TaxID=3127471 RepID=UPI0030D18054